MNEFTALQKAVKLSKEFEYKDTVIIVFKKKDGDYSIVPYIHYAGDDQFITERYMNGSIVKI